MHVAYSDRRIDGGNTSSAYYDYFHGSGILHAGFRRQLQRQDVQGGQQQGLRRPSKIAYRIGSTWLRRMTRFLG